MSEIEQKYHFLGSKGTNGRTNAQPRFIYKDDKSCFYDTICRTLLLPIRYRTITDALSVCEALGEKGDFLKPFSSFEEWSKFYNRVKNSPAMDTYCDHGGETGPSFKNVHVARAS